VFISRRCLCAHHRGCASPKRCEAQENSFAAPTVRSEGGPREENTGERREDSGDRTEGERNRYIDDYEPVACAVRAQQCVTSECMRACVRACVRASSLSSSLSSNPSQ